MSNRIEVDPTMLIPAYVFDTEILPHAKTPQSIEFFGRHVGQKMIHAKIKKTDKHTSMQNKNIGRRFGARGLVVQYGNTSVDDLYALHGNNQFECSDCHWCDELAYKDLYACPSCKKTQPEWKSVRENHGLVSFYINGDQVFAVLLQNIPPIPIFDVLPVSVQFFKFVDAPSVLTIKDSDIIKATISWPMKAPVISRDLTLRFGLLGAFTPTASTGA